MYYSEFVTTPQPEPQIEKVRKQSMKTVESEAPQPKTAPGSFLKKLLWDGQQKCTFDLLKVRENRYYDSLVGKPRRNSEVLVKPNILVENNYVKTRKLSQIVDSLDFDQNAQQKMGLIID